MAKRRARGEGTVYKEKARNRWVGAVEIGGRRRKVTGKTQTEARTKLNALLRQRDLDEPIGDGNITVKELLQQWKDRELAARDVAPSTRQVNLWAVDRLTEGIGSLRVSNLKVKDIEDVFDSWADDLSHSSMVKLRSVLSQALRFGMRRGLAVRNIAPDVIIPPSAARSEERTPLTPAELVKFLRVLHDKRLGALFAIAATVGLRPGEVSGLRWNAVDLDRGHITISSALRLDKGKPVIVDRLKTKGSYRTVTLPSAVADLVRERRVSYTEERAGASRWDDPELVFSTNVGTPISPSNLRRELLTILSEAGLPEISPNDLRHTASSVLSDAGVPLERIADLLGHTTTRMLDETYRHRVRPSIDAAAEMFDSLLSETPGADGHR